MFLAIEIGTFIKKNHKFDEFEYLSSCVRSLCGYFIGKGSSFIIFVVDAKSYVDIDDFWKVSSSCTGL